MNLSPREPATLNWPLYSLPPPHFLVGYQYIVKVCNDYIFDTRAYSRIKYSQIITSHQQIVNWSVMANCTYTVNTGAYHRFIDLENFNETLNQIQQAILTDRIVADMALLRPMRGFGSVQIDGQQIPSANIMQQNFRNIGECQDQAWGMADRIRLHQSGKKDLIILQTIRKLKNAYFNYLLSSNAQNKLSLPCDCDWLDAFVENFNTENEDLVRAVSLQPMQTIMKAVISTLTLSTKNSLNLLKGGAFELRPRENGRAVTEQMRRNRGEMIERFVDRLPIRRRRQRPTPQPIIEEEIDAEENVTFEEEVRQAVAQAIQTLEQELTVVARNQQFFNFALSFYEIIQRLEAMGEINEMTLRRWVMYFFVTEHIATTFNYLNYYLKLSSPFNRIVELNLAQVVMRARDEMGRIIYSRVWNENGINAFTNLMQRITTDLTATVERAGHGLNNEEMDQFMADIAYHDNSGDVQEIVKQLEMNDVEIDSIELSFRFKVTGPVVFSQNREIQSINRRVVQLASSLRQERRELPPLNAQVQLPN